MKIIDIKSASKTYKGKVKALDHVSLEVHGGEIFGLLGPNGAGKSTLVKILMTIIKASHIDGTLLNNPIGHKPTLKNVGYLPENPIFPIYFNALDALNFYGALSGASKQICSQRCQQLLKSVNLTDAAKRKISTYSKGMRQRLGLAQALIHDPQLVILDEPTDGLDPVGRKEFRDIIVDLKKNGKTIFLNSHLLGELELVCDRIAILADGQLKKQGHVKELSSKKEYYQITLADPPQQWINKISTSLSLRDIKQNGDDSSQATLANGQWLETEKNILRCGLATPHEIQPVIEILRQQQLVISEIHLKKPSLEELFFETINDPNQS